MKAALLITKQTLRYIC